MSEITFEDSHVQITEARCLEVTARETGERIGWLIECGGDPDQRWVAMATLSLRDQIVGFAPTARLALGALERNERELDQVRARRRPAQPEWPYAEGAANGTA